MSSYVGFIEEVQFDGSCLVLLLCPRRSDMLNPIFEF